MWLPPIAPTHWGTFRQFSKTSAISFNFLESGNLMCTCRRTFITACRSPAHSWIQCSLQPRKADWHFCTHCQWQASKAQWQFVFSQVHTSGNWCSFAQAHVWDDNRCTQKTPVRPGNSGSNCSGVNSGTNGIPPLVLSRIGPHCRCPSSHDHQGYLLRRWRCTDII